MRTPRPSSPSPLRPFAAAPASPGFSLMEVTISLAIVAIACIPLIGMLPAGMKTMRDGQREAIESEVVRLLTNELSMSNWSDTNDLKEWESDLLFFDDQGVSVETEQDATYAAKIDIEEETTLPGAPNKNAFLKRVTIRITNKPEVVSDRFTAPKWHRTYSLLVAKTDK